MEFGWFTWIGSELTKKFHKPSADAYKTFDLYISGAVVVKQKSHSPAIHILD